MWCSTNVDKLAEQCKTTPRAVCPNISGCRNVTAVILGVGRCEIKDAITIWLLQTVTCVNASLEEISSDRLNLYLSFVPAAFSQPDVPSFVAAHAIRKPHIEQLCSATGAEFQSCASHSHRSQDFRCVVNRSQDQVFFFSPLSTACLYCFALSYSWRWL